ERETKPVSLVAKPWNYTDRSIHDNVSYHGWIEFGGVGERAALPRWSRAGSRESGCGGGATPRPAAANAWRPLRNSSRDGVVVGDGQNATHSSRLLRRPRHVAVVV